MQDRQPIALPGEQYTLVTASAEDTQHLTTAAACAWIDAGACYVCAWWPGSDAVEEAFDYASFLPELGEPLSFTLMTTSHRNETLEEALWFACYNSQGPQEQGDGTIPVVVVAHTEALEAQGIAWVQNNRE